MASRNGGGFRVKRIDHVEVMVRDIARAERWYREVLGLRRVTAWDPEPVMIGRGGTKLALFRRAGAARERRLASARLGWRRVAFLTDPRGFRAARARLERRRISYRGPVDHGSWLSIYFHDPDGILLEITRPAAGRRSR